MYTLSSALGKSLAEGQQWSAIDLGGMTFATVAQNYSVVYAILTNPFLPKPVCLNLASILSTITNQQQTFNAYLTSLGNASLPTQAAIPTLTQSYAKYQDAFKAGYTIQPIGMTQAVSYGAVTSAKPDLLVTRPSTNYNTLYQSCLMSVNGFFHMTDTDGQTGVWVNNGMLSAVRSGKNKLGLLSFQDLGTLTMIPITAAMVYKQNTSQSLCNHAYINVGRDLTNSTVMVVIGGYLHVLDNKTFTLVGTESIMIDFNNYPLFERYYESKDFIDMSSLALSAYPTNADAVSVEDITSDAAIKALLSLPQSFVVLLNNTNISVELTKVKTGRGPGMYTCYEEPIWPLLTGYGKLNEYWSVEEAGQWSLKCEDAFKANYLFNTVVARQQVTVTNQRAPQNPVALSPAYFMQIACEIAFS